MRTIQKLELSSGIAALLAGIFQIMFFVSTVEQGDDHSTIVVIIYGVIFLLLPLIIINVCTYFHISQKSKVSFAVILILGGIFVCFFGFLILFGLLIGPPMKTPTLIGVICLVSQCFLIICTMLFAIINTASLPSPKDNYI